MNGTSEAKIILCMYMRVTLMTAKTISHDRIKNFKQANLENLIYSLSALFILNVYYMDKVFYEIDTYNHDRIIEKIEEEYSFFNAITYFEVAKQYATYVIYEDVQFKTPGDEVSDSMQKLESNVMVYNKENQTLKKFHDSYEFKDHYTKCKLVAKLNRNI